MSAPASTPYRWTNSARRILPLAWPVIVGQISVLAFSIVDTAFVARTSPTDLAALAVASAAYISTFVGFMGVVMALAPIVGQLYGAGRHAEVGHQVRQGLWVALGLSLLGIVVLVFPAPFLALAKATPEVAERVRAYLLALACSLPAALAFMVYRTLNTAVSRPKAVMALQIGGLVLKVPLTAALVFGMPALSIPPLGVVGCGIATAVSMWGQLILSMWILRRDPLYRPFAIFGAGIERPDAASIRALLKLGVPMGASILVEVTGFAFMSIFIARLGTTPVAGHQLVMNLVSVIFMVPLGLANATSALVAQSVGAGDARDARRLGWHGLVIACAIACVLGGGVYLWRDPLLHLYTGNEAIIAAALPLMAWLAIFHVADTAQTLAAFVLRAYKIATVPMVIYVAALWVVGLGGGYVLAFDVPGGVPPALHGARGFWFASTVGLVIAGSALSAFMLWVFSVQRREGARATG